MVTRYPDFPIDASAGGRSGPVPLRAPDPAHSCNEGTGGSADGPNCGTFSRSGDRWWDQHTRSVYGFCDGGVWAVLSDSWGVLSGTTALEYPDGGVSHV
jgi:hypothetical protein